MLTEHISYGFIAVIDLKVIKASVDYVFESVYPDPNPMISGLGPTSRKDILSNVEYFDEENEDLVKIVTEIKTRNSFRSGITTLIGALLQKQQCLELAACTLGEHLKEFAAKDVVLM